MSENCNHDCANCAENCADRKMSKADFLVKPHETTHIKKVIGVVSGKGGVGKSLVTSALAVAARRKGHRVAVLDSDKTGTSIHKAFGLKEQAMGNAQGIIPCVTKSGIEVMSLNLLLEDETAPVVWRGPIIAGTVKQFWSEVLWGDVDYMFIDMPPGTGDVALTVFQSIPLDGLVIVTTPQELVGMIVEKSYNMAHLMDIPVLALVENMSYITCPDCGKKISVFGESHVDGTAARLGIPHTVRLPINPDFARMTDSGGIEDISCPEIEELVGLL